MAESAWLPEPPGYVFIPAVVDQRFHVEIWCEKTTVADVLLQLAREYSLNVVMGAGDLSVTHCHQLVEGAKRSRRPVRLLYVSDFDPQGHNMPLVARKIVFLIRMGNLDLDVQVGPVVLTHEQCVAYRLPRIPIKETAHGKDRFEGRFGEGATELDALEALRPGVLRRILVEEIERYHDGDLDDQVGEVADGFREQLDDAHRNVLDRHQAEIEALRTEQRNLAERCNAELAPIVERCSAELAPIIQKYQLDIEEIVESFNAIASELADEAPDPDEIDWPEPAEGDEDPDPLFDSTQDFVEQIDRIKQYQDRATVKKIRSDKGRPSRGNCPTAEAAHNEHHRARTAARPAGQTLPRFALMRDAGGRHDRRRFCSFRGRTELREGRPMHGSRERMYLALPSTITRTCLNSRGNTSRPALA
jgi:hypothetical protein